MPILSHSVPVPYPPEVVFDFVADAENNPRWHAHVNETHWVDDREIGLGRAARQTGHLWGRDWVLEARIVEWEPPHLVTYETTKGVRARTSLRVDPDPAGARLSMTVKTGPNLGTARSTRQSPDAATVGSPWPRRHRAALCGP